MTWYRRCPEAGVAIVCGRVSSVVVVDGDPRNGDGLAVLAPHMPQTWTGRRGALLLHRPAVAAIQGCGTAARSRPPGGTELRRRGALNSSERSAVPLAAWSRPRRGAARPAPPTIRDLIALRREREADTRARTPRSRLLYGALSLETALGRLARVRRCGSEWLDAWTPA
jgi:hypothetical protein